MGSDRSAWFHVIATALLLTGLNAIKPLHIDDPFYLTYGAEFAAHPLDPYAFRYGSPVTEPANDVIAPPVVPYWLGLGQLLFGDRPVLLKCWLFPFALALAWAVDFLAARIAPSLRAPVLWLAVLSPTLLPGFNCMLEAPVFALGLSALAVAIRALERDSWTLTLLAGLLGGLAIQTKYTGIVACAAIMVYCVLNRRPARGLIIAALALSLATGWECFVAATQGESHFLVQLGLRQGGSLGRCLHLVLPLLSQVAGLAPAVALLGFAALGWSGWRLLAVALTLLLGFVDLALAPSQAALVESAGGRPLLTPSNVIYALMAIPVWGGLLGAGLRLARRADTGGEDRRLDLFLLAWLVLEFGGYFALSPWPAARRVAGLLMVFTMLAGRLAHLRGVAPRLAGRLAVGGVALSLSFFGTDLLDARAAQIAAGRVAHTAEGGSFWHLSWWGFSYYAEREGLRPLQLDRKAPQPGDRLAVHDVLVDKLKEYPWIELELIDIVRVGDGFPLRLMDGYYAGRTPIEHQGDCRMRVFVYRVTNVAYPPSPSIASGRTRWSNSSPVR